MTSEEAARYSATSSAVCKKIRERNEAITKKQDKDRAEGKINLTLYLARKAGMCK